MYYMKDLVRGFVKWFVIVLLTLNVILWVTVATKCQEYDYYYPEEKTHSELHKDRKEWEDSIRYRIAEITSVDGDLIYWKKETRREIKLSSFGYDKTLQVEKGWINKPTGCHQMWYCITHNFVYMIYSLDKKWCKE